MKMFNSMEASSKRRQDKREEDVDLAKSGRKRSMRPPLLSVDDRSVASVRVLGCVSSGYFSLLQCLQRQTL